MQNTARNEQTETDKLIAHIAKGYNMECHSKSAPCLYRKNGGEVVADYEPMKFSTFRVFFASKGTVLDDSIIWVEQSLITIIFISSAIPMYIYFNHDADIGHGNDASMRKWISAQEPRMRDFAMIMTVLASLLLSFYTAIAVGRWWVIRTQGVGGIKAAAVEITNLLTQAVTQDKQVLDSVRRYAQASLCLVFLWRRGHLGRMKEEMVTMKILTEQEADQMLKWNHDLHETVWAWQTAIVCTLWQEGRIKSDMVFRQLLERCSDGRKAVQCIHTYLAVKIPMQYVHLLGLLVKMHNMVLSIIMGTLFGAAIRNAETIIAIQLAGRTLVLPLLFNAILLINAELSDPFDGGPCDFPGLAYKNALEKDANGFVAAAQNMPTWLEKRSLLPK